MNIKSLTLKNILLDDNDEKYYDLSVPSFDLSSTGVTDVHLTTQDEEGRVDKICEKYYGCTDYIDILCFANHIFNPFAVEKDELLIIPNILSSSEEVYFMPEVPSWLSENNATQNNKKAVTNEKDTNRINRLKKQNEYRKSNELKNNTEVKKYVNGKIILGTHLNTTNG